MTLHLTGWDVGRDHAISGGQEGSDMSAGNPVGRNLSQWTRMALAGLLLAVVALVGLLLDHNASDASSPTPFAFSATSVNGITVEQGRSPDYTPPKIKGLTNPGNGGACSQVGTVTLSADDGNGGTGLHGLKLEDKSSFGPGEKPNVKIKGTATASSGTTTFTVTVTCIADHLAQEIDPPTPISYTIPITFAAYQHVPMAFTSNSVNAVKLVKDAPLSNAHNAVNKIIGRPNLTGDRQGPVSYSVSPALPAGLSLGASSGRITGTPTALAANATYTITATDKSTTPQTATFTVDISVIGPLAFSPASRSITVHQNDRAFSTTIPLPANLRGTTSWDTPITESAKSLADLGLRFVESSRRLEWYDPSGDATPGQYQYTFKIHEDYRGAQSSQTAELTLNIDFKPPKALVFPNRDLGLKIVAVSSSTVSIPAPASKHGTTPLSYAISPALPSGLTISSSTGEVSGTAPSSPAAATQYTVTATDASTPAQSASYTFELLIKPSSGMAFVPNAIGSTTPIDVEVNEDVSDVLADHAPHLVNIPADCASPVPLLKLSNNGSFELVSSSGSSGDIYLHPSTTNKPAEGYDRYFLHRAAPASMLGQTRHYRVEVMCGSGTAHYTIKIRGVTQLMKFKPGHLGHKQLSKNKAVSIDPPTLVAATAPVTYAKTTSGYTWPTGLSLNTSTGVISGTPTTSWQLKKYEVTATDSGGSTAAFTIDLSVINVMEFGSASLPDQSLTVGTQMTALNPPLLRSAEGAVTYVVSPSLPAGLAINSSTGVISGTPTAAAALATYVVTATDSKSPTAQEAQFAVKIKVNPATAMAFSGTKADQVLAADQAANVTALSLTNSVGTVTYGISPTTLATGLSFSTASGAITGTPTAAKANTSYTISATDANGQTAQYSFSIEVRKPSIDFNATTSNLDEDDGTHNVQVDLSPAPAAALTVSYSIGGTATSGSDYTALSGSLSVAKGATSVNIPVVISDDSADDDDETVILTITSGSGYSVGTDSAHTVTIADNDATIVSLARTDSGNIAEAGSGTKENAEFTVSLGRNLTNGETIEVPLVLSGTNVTAADVNIAKKSGATINHGVTIANGGTLTPTITFTGHDTNTVQTATLLLTSPADSTTEQAETITVELGPDDTTTNGFDEANRATNVEGGAHPHASNNSFDVNVDADTPPSLPKVSFHELTSTVQEDGGTHNVKVDLTKAPGSGNSITISYTITGTATSGSDYTALAGTVTVSGSNTSVTIPITITDDALDESDETIVLTLTDGSGYSLTGVRAARKTHTVTITDDDGQSSSLPTVSFSSATSSAAEDAGTHNVALTLSAAASSSIAVNYTVSGTATAGTDYTTLSGSVVFVKGGTSVNIPVAISDDSTDETDETIVLTLSDGTTYDLGSTKKHTLTITDNDDPPPNTPVVSISAGSHVTEGTAASFTIAASPAPSSAVTLNYTVTQSGSFVTSGNLNAQTLSLNSGSATITVPTVGDSLDEANGSVTVTLNSGTGYSVSNTNNAATVNVYDDDVTSVSFASATSSASEGVGTKNVTISLSPVPATALTLSYTVGGTATSGTDFTTRSGTLSVAKGASSVSLPVPITDDSTDELDETIILTLTSGTNYQLGSTTVHTLTITDNDVPAVSFGASASGIGEAGGTKNVTVNISPAPASGLTLSYSVGGTATAGSDYPTLSGTISIAQGQTLVTIPVAVTNDSVVNEPAETIILTLTSGSGYSLGSTTTHTLTITDDDKTTPTASFSISSATIMEGPNKVQNVVVNFSPPPTTSITLRISVSGSATEGSDYQTLSRTKTVTAGATSTTISIHIIDDNVEDTGEKVILLLLDGTSNSYNAGNPGTFTLTITNDDAPAPKATSKSQRKAHIPSDPPNFCRGPVSEVADPPQQVFPTLGKDIAPQRPCRGSGLLSLYDLDDTLNSDQSQRERGFYITAQLHEISDFRSRFRGSADNKLYIVDSATKARYGLLNPQRMIELSLWLIVRSPLQDTNSVQLLGRNEALSEEFSICLPFKPTRRTPFADIARWDPSSLSWSVLDLAMTDADDQVCALTDQVSSFILVTPADPPQTTDTTIPQPGDPH